MNRTVRSVLERVQMKINLDKWLLGQCGREDSVGELARRWVRESAEGKIPDHYGWFAELEKSEEWSRAALQVKKEYAIAVDFLARGESAPTFPRLIASEGYGSTTF